MSAQSGIQPDAALLEAWSQAIADQSLRIFTIKLENEQLVHAGSVQREGTAEEDYALLAGQAQPSTPSYFLFRLDDAAGWLVRETCDSCHSAGS